MLTNLPFALTTLSYIALILFNLQKINATGERLAGWGIIAFVLLAAYIVCSLILTISIAAKGGFNWLSDTVFLRNAGVGLLWLGMMVGMVYCTLLRAEWPADQSGGLARWLSVPVYFGAVWLPLLMLLPYAILLNPEWRDTLSPNLYKIPLMLGCVVGLFIWALPGIVNATRSFSVPQERDESQLAFNNSMNIINNESAIQELLFFTHREQDERLRNAALTKIKAHKDWEDELTSMLQQNNPYDIYWVYAFLDGNQIEHPEQFVTPVNNSIPSLTSKIQESIQDPYKDNLAYLNVEVLCRVLDVQFKDSSAVFRPNILKLQGVLETPPAARTGDIDAQKFVETLDQYRLAVKNWLDTH